MELAITVGVPGKELAGVWARIPKRVPRQRSNTDNFLGGNFSSVIVANNMAKVNLK